MIIESAVVLAVLGTIGATAKSFIYTVNEKEEAVVQSFGKYQTTKKSTGLNFKLPWKSVTKVSTALTELKEDLQAKTKDNIFVTLPIKTYIRVEDAKKFALDTEDPVKQVLSLIAVAVKQLSSQTDFADLYTARETISHRVNESVGKELFELYGVRLIDVIVDEPNVSEELRARYNNVKASEMDKAAAINAAEIKKAAIIAEAEARKEALRLDGEGIAIQRREIFAGYATQFNSLVQQGISADHAQQIIMTAMANDTLRDAAQHGNLILANNNLQASLQEMSAVQKLVGQEGALGKLQATPKVVK